MAGTLAAQLDSSQADALARAIEAPFGRSPNNSRKTAYCYSPACFAARAPMIGSLNVWLLYALTIRKTQQTRNPSQRTRKRGPGTKNQPPCVIAPETPHT